MKRKTISHLILAALFAPVLAAGQALPQTGPQGFNFDGKLFNPDGSAMTSASIPINVKIYNAAMNCLLYEETQTVDTTVSNGAFSITVGSPIGAAKRSGNDPGQTMAAIFQNKTPIPAYGGSCAGSIFSPAAGEKRYMRVTVNSNVLTPDFPIEATPFAISAESLRGMIPSDFISVTAAANLTQNNLESVFTGGGYTALTDLIAGTSGLYMKASPTSNVSFGGNVIQNVGTPSAGTDATNKDYVDGSIGGKAATITGVAPGVGGGKTIIWDQVQNKWVAGDAADPSKLPLAGGTMSGAIDMGSYDLNNVGHVTMLSGRALHLGKFTNASEGSLAVGLSAPDSGKTWYNSDTNSIHYWNGTSVVNINAGGGGITALTGEVTASGSGSVAATISNNSISTAKVFSPAGANRLVATDPTTGNSLVPFACPNYDQVAVWRPTGWECTGGQLTVTGGGNVGIGMTTATYRLDVNGTIQARPYGAGAGQTGQLKLMELAANGSNAVTISSPDNLVADLNFILPATTGSNGQYLSTDGSGNLSWISPSMFAGGSHGEVQFNSGGALVGTPTFMWDTANGRLGVGTGSPTAKFEVDGTNAANPVGIFKAASGQSVDIVRIADGGGGIVFRVDPTGSVAIGNTVPSSALTVVGTIHSTTGGIKFPDGTVQTTSAAGAFNPNGSVPMTGPLIASAGSQGTPSLAFNGDPDTGFFNSGANTIGVSTTGTHRYSFTDTMITSSAAGGPAMTFSVGSSGTPPFTFNDDTDTGMFHPAANTIGFSTSGTERARIDAAGNLGVGTVSPAVKLDVAGQIFSRPYGASAGQTGQIIMGELGANGTDAVILRAADNLSATVTWTLPAFDGAANTYLTTNGAGLLSWATPAGIPGGSTGNVQYNSGGSLAGASALNWDSANNRLGVGASAPTAKFEVVGSDATTPTMRVRGYAGQTSDLFGIFDGAASLKVRVSSSGNVGIGTTSAPAQMLEVGGDSIINGLRIGKGANNQFNATAVGVSVLGSNTGASVTGVGYQALFSNTSGYSNTAVGDSAMKTNTTGFYNSAFGWSSLYANSTGSLNVAVGRNALYSTTSSNNTAVGANAGSTLSTGGGNTLIGYNSGSGLVGQNNVLIIGSAPGTSMATDEIAISTSGSAIDRIRIDASGNMGLGTTSPTDRLHIVSASSNLLKLDSPSQPAANMMFNTSTGQASVRLDTVLGNPSFQVDVGNNGADLYVSNLGWVGVGNSSPAAPLHVNGGIVSSEKVLATGSSVDFALANNWVLQSVGGTVITVNNMVFGGVYRIIVQDAASRTYTFSGCSNSYYNPANGSTGGAQTIYTITYSTGGKCYIKWDQY